MQRKKSASDISSEATNDNPARLFALTKRSSLRHTEKNANYALLMLHSGDSIQLMIAKRICEQNGYKTIVIDKPKQPDTIDAQDSIKRLRETIDLYLNCNITFALVEANYSHYGSERPNDALLRYIIKNIVAAKHLFITTATDKCNDAIHNNKEFEGVHLTGKGYADIRTFMKLMEPRARKNSLQPGSHAE